MYYVIRKPQTTPNVLGKISVLKVLPKQSLKTFGEMSYPRRILIRQLTDTPIILGIKTRKFVSYITCEYFQW